MTAERRRSSTRLGMGAVTTPEEPASASRGVDCPAPRAAPSALDAMPLPYRETVAAMPATELATASGSGIRRRTCVMEAGTAAPPPPEPSLPRTARLAAQASRERVASAALSTHEAFVLGMIDGTLTVEEIVDASAMREEDALPIVERLLRLGLVGVLAG